MHLLILRSAPVYLPSLMSLALLATAQPSAAQTTNPHWIRPPDPGAVANLMPGFANSLGISGVATIRCEIERAGPPQACVVVSESPTGLGFGQAGVQAAMTGYLAPKLVKGSPTRAQVQLNVNFRAFPIELLAVTTSPYTGPEPSPRAIEMARSIVRRDLPKILDQGYDLRGLAPERHAEVIGWIQTVMPLDRKDLIDTFGLVLARVSDEADLQAALDDGIWPSHFPEAKDWDAASSDLLNKETVKGIEAIRLKYCARYSCTID